MVFVRLLLLIVVVQASLRGSRVVNTLYAVDLGAGPWATGVLFALHGLFPFLLAVFAGRIADRFDNRTLLLVGVVTFAAQFALPLAFPGLATLFVSVPLGGLTSMVYVLAVQNLVGVLATPQTRTRCYSWYAIAESTAGTLGPVMVGLAIDTLDYRGTYLALALYTLAAALLVTTLRSALPSGVRPDAPDDAPRTMSDLLRLPQMRRALATNGLVMAGIDLFQLYLPVYAHGIGLSASAIGVIVGAFGAASFVSRLAITPVTARWGDQRMIAGALALSAVAFVAFPLTQDPWLLAAIAFGVGLGLGCGQPLSMALAFTAAPKGRNAEAIAMRLAVSYGAHLVIPPVFGAIGAVAGLAPIFWSCALLLGGGAWINRARARSDADR